MQIKKIGKVHPSPSSINESDCLSVLKLLPAVILLKVSSLSAGDKEVLAYLVTRSLKTTTAVAREGRRSPSDSKKSISKKKKITHKPPLFDCECFDCYTSYWIRWDSSPKRELIHQIIEAFEDHLTTGENSGSQNPKRNNGKGKKKEQEEPVTEQVKTLVASDESGNEMKMVTTGYKGLARKVLPDLLGLFKSRFWSLWYLNA